MRSRKSKIRTKSAPRWSRRGVAVLVVLLLVSAALAISYATMRTQSTHVQIQHNASLADDARQAAITGLTLGLKKMHEADWRGVGTTLSGSLGGRLEYTVTYTAGDPSLSEADDDYADFAYRVTLQSIGYATDAADPDRRASHEAKAVVRLIPRKMPNEPGDWNRMQDYVVYQTKVDDFDLDIPCQIAGGAHVLGQLRFATHYPDDSDAWSRYLTDLNRMRQDNKPDYRPLTGPVQLWLFSQDWSGISFLRSNLGVAADYTFLPEEVGSDWNQPTGLSDYQIYPGGPTYTVQTLPHSLENATLEPDPKTNPLGLYYRNGSMEVRDNVTIRGTVFCRDDIKITGTNVHFEAVEVPSVYGSSDPMQLPVATCQDFEIKSTAGGSLNGLVAVFDDFVVLKGPDTTTFAITGKVVTRSLSIDEREPWNRVDWDGYYSQFDAYRRAISPTPAYFPIWMGDRGYNPQPLVTVAEDPDDVVYHWKYPDDCLFVPHPDDATDLSPTRPGLRWDLLEWTSDLK